MAFYLLGMAIYRQSDHKGPPKTHTHTHTRTHTPAGQ